MGTGESGIEEPAASGRGVGKMSCGGVLTESRLCV